MRNLIVASLIVLFTGTAFAGNGIGELVTIFSNENIEFTVLDTENNSLFTNIEFIDVKSDFSVQTHNKVQFIKVLNASGELEFQMPIMSKHMHIDLNGYTSGEYEIYMQVEGHDDEVISQLTIK